MATTSLAQTLLGDVTIDTSTSPHTVKLSTTNAAFAALTPPLNKRPVSDLQTALKDESLKLSPPPTGDTKLKIDYVRNALNSAIYVNTFAFSGTIKILDSNSFTIQKNPTIPSRIEMGKNQTVTINVGKVAAKFGLDATTAAKLGTSSISLKDFMLDTKTKEYSIGVTAEHPLEFLEAVGAGFVKDIIDIEELDINLSRLVRGSDTPT